MCDSLARLLPGRVLFAKNSDRDANEAQLLDWHPAMEHPRGARLRCTWIEIPQVERTHAVLLSRPFWMWGAEIGANEHGLAIGNEAVFTREHLPRLGLTGMDLLRLALERARDAEEAVEVITSLLSTHGQGGGCGFERRSFRYSSSFLIADPGGAIVLETAGRAWAAEQVAEGTRTLSNRLSIPAFRSRHERALPTRIAQAALRQARTAQSCSRAGTSREMAAILRDHGAAGRWPRYRPLTGGLGAPCMHGGGALFGSVTTASWIAELRSDGNQLHWVTATAAPCLSLFKPARAGEPLDLGPPPGERAGSHIWWRHERLHRSVMRDPERLVPDLLAERDAIEAAWWIEPPEPAAAFTAHGELLSRHLARIESGAPPHDRRPAWARRYWRSRNGRAGIEC